MIDRFHPPKGNWTGLRGAGQESQCESRGDGSGRILSGVVLHASRRPVIEGLEMDRSRCSAALYLALGLLIVASCGPGEPRAEFEAIAAELRDGTNVYVGRGQIAGMEQVLERGDLTPAQRVEMLAGLGWHYLRTGDVDRALARLDAAEGMAGDVDLDEEFELRFLQLRGVAYLRQAEVQNCILRHNRDCCLLPLRGRGVHDVPEPARRARAVYAALLERMPATRPRPGCSTC